MSAGTYRSSPGQSPAACEVKPSGSDINIYLREGGEGLLIWNSRSLSHCALVGGQLTARYKDAELICHGDAARHIYQHWLDRDKVFPDNAGGRTFRNVVIVLTLFFLGLAALLYFFVLPWAADKATRLIPKEAEIELGEKMSAAFKQDNPGTGRADSLLNAFASSISFHTEYPLRLHVLHSPDINAFALPGGNIFVHTGILCKMTSHEQLAALLAHEVTHVDKRHSLRGIARSAASGLLIAAIFGDAGGVSGAIVNQANEFQQLGYSRELETEADLHGLELLRRNGIRQQGMLDLLSLLDREGAKTPGLMKYLSTHPETGERIQSVRENLAADESARLEDKLSQLFEQLQEEVN